MLNLLKAKKRCKVRGSLIYICFFINPAVYLDEGYGPVLQVKQQYASYPETLKQTMLSMQSLETDHYRWEPIHIQEVTGMQRLTLRIEYQSNHGY